MLMHGGGDGVELQYVGSPAAEIFVDKHFCGLRQNGPKIDLKYLIFNLALGSFLLDSRNNIQHCPVQHKHTKSGVGIELRRSPPIFFFFSHKITQSESRQLVSARGDFHSKATLLVIQKYGGMTAHDTSITAAQRFFHSNSNTNRRGCSTSYLRSRRAMVTEEGERRGLVTRQQQPKTTKRVGRSDDVHRYDRRRAAADAAVALLLLSSVTLFLEFVYREKSNNVWPVFTSEKISNNVYLHSCTGLLPIYVQQ